MSAPEAPTAAMILAAGLGSRLRPLTQQVPKPLLEVGGRPLIVHHLERLAAAGVRRAVVNLHHLGGQIRRTLGDGSAWGLELRYSEEPELLDTAGGIRAALDLLAVPRFLVISADVVCDLTPERLGALASPERSAAACHLLLAPRPSWRETGDFALAPTGEPRPLREATRPPLVYAGIGAFAAELFRDLPGGPQPLRPVLDAAIAADDATGEIHTGFWDDVGTVQRLEAARARFHDAGRSAAPAG